MNIDSGLLKPYLDAMKDAHSVYLRREIEAQCPDEDDSENQRILAKKAADQARLTFEKSCIQMGHACIEAFNEFAARRTNYEDFCSCINVVKTLQPCTTMISDSEAVAFYEKNCKCSLNYIRS